MCPRLQLWPPGLLGVWPLQEAPTCTSWVEVGPQMWEFLARSWPLARCHTGPWPLIWPLQTLCAWGPWFPGTLPLVTGILPPAAENWPDIIDAVPEKKWEEDQVVWMWQWQGHREIESQTEPKGIPGWVVSGIYPPLMPVNPPPPSRLWPSQIWPALGWRFLAPLLHHPLLWVSHLTTKELLM